MKKHKRYTQNELNQIINDYNNHISLSELGKKYDRNPASILKKLTDIGIYTAKNLKWTKSELNILKQNYSTCDWNELLNLLSNRTKEQIISKASKLNIKKDNYFWNKKDINILINAYNNGMSTKEIIVLLDNKFTDSSICKKANKLGLHTRCAWSKKEIDIMNKYYNVLTVDEMLKLLPNRTKDAIIGQAQKLEIKSFCVWTPEEDKYIIENWEITPDIIMASKLDRTFRSVKWRREYLKCFRRPEGLNYEYLNKYLRINSKDWREDSIKQCNYKCIITGREFDDVHHIYSMNLMIKETLTNTGILEKKMFDDYTPNELEQILKEFKYVQSKHPMGVCVTKDIHKLFHSLYTYGNNTPEQWYSFVSNYKQGKYNFLTDKNN